MSNRYNVKFMTGKSQSIRQVDITAESVAEAKEKVKAMYSSGGDIAKIVSCVKK